MSDQSILSIDSEMEEMIILDRLDNLYDIIEKFFVLITLVRVILFTTTNFLTDIDMGDWRTNLVIWLTILLAYIVVYTVMASGRQRIGVRLLMLLVMVDLYLNTYLFPQTYGSSMFLITNIIVFTIVLTYRFWRAVSLIILNQIAILLFTLLLVELDFVEVFLGAFMFNLVASTSYIFINQNLMKRSFAKHQMLVEQERESRMIIDHAGDTIIISNTHGEILLANPIASKLTGYSQEELHSMTVPDLDPNVVDLPKFVQGRNQMEMSSDSLIVERIIQHKSGEQIPVEISVQKLTQDRFISILRNLGERRTRENERNKLLSTIEQSTSMIIIMDADGRIEYANPTFIDKTGFTAEEIAGVHPRDIYTDSEALSIYEGLLKSVAKGKDWGGELMNRTKDGSIFWTHATISAVYDHNGKVINFISIQDDVTEEKRIKEELKEREEQVLQLQKMEAIGRFAGGVAHDFNNILMVMLGYSEFILTSMSEEDELFEYITEIHKNAERASELTGQLLTFSKKQIAQPHDLPVDAVIKDAMTLVKRIIGEDIEITKHLNAANALFAMDKNQFEQIILNLASNARDAMPDGGEYTISTRVLQESAIPSEIGEQIGGDLLEISFKDSGSGIDPEIKSMVFDPFFTTKDSGMNTGLGLSTVYGIVQQNSGQIRVDSQAGEGATFLLYFPLIEGIAEYSDSVHEDLALDLSPYNLFIVEDEPDVAKLLTKAIEMLDGNVQITHTAEDCIKKIRDGEVIDLLITDLVLPDMNGYQLSLQVKEDLSNVKVLYISGYSKDTIPPEVTQLEDFNFLGKPFTIAEFHRKLSSILGASPLDPPDL